MRVEASIHSGYKFYPSYGEDRLFMKWALERYFDGILLHKVRDYYTFRAPDTLPLFRLSGGNTFINPVRYGIFTAPTLVEVSLPLDTVFVDAYHAMAGWGLTVDINSGLLVPSFQLRQPKSWIISNTANGFHSNHLPQLMMKYDIPGANEPLTAFTGTFNLATGDFKGTLKSFGTEADSEVWLTLTNKPEWHTKGITRTTPARVVGGIVLADTGMGIDGIPDFKPCIADIQGEGFNSEGLLVMGDNWYYIPNAQVDTRYLVDQVKLLTDMVSSLGSSLAVVGSPINPQVVLDATALSLELEAKVLV